ncbi:hypothetical protein U9M48_009633 [Paspalum notatum var. saurae]|uniref:Uncharacterized protein n=1 Tax=Paspalum notatum var. saurae TaxID=547442 RepID=A0AAQ3ST11_PASNO
MAAAYRTQPAAAPIPAPPVAPSPIPAGRVSAGRAGCSASAAALRWPHHPASRTDRSASAPAAPPPPPVAPPRRRRSHLRAGRASPLVAPPRRLRRPCLPSGRTSTPTAPAVPPL